MKKILYVTTLSRTINAFLVPHIQMLIDNGYKVDCACSVDKELDKNLINKGVNVFDIPFARNPFSIGNIKAFKKLIKIQKENKYDIVHVHTPIASFITRFALRRNKVKMIYTCHGFHFYKGAPIVNWLVYYPLERIAARWTDVLVTINSEDLQIANNFNLRCNGNVFLMHGVGINNKEYKIGKFDRNNYRKELGIEKDDFLILVLAELNNNKNHMQLIKSVNLIKDKYPNIKVICAGEGPLEEKLKDFVKNKSINDRIKFIGFRKDVKELLYSADCVGLFSKREGLGKCLLEGIITNNVIIATNTRGPKEIIKNNENGFLVEIGDYKDTAKKIELLYRNKDIRDSFIKKSNKIIEKYFLKNVLKEIEDFY